VSTPASGPADAVTGMLLQITQHAERLAALDEREAGHYREITSRLTELARQLTETSERVTETSERADAAHATAARQAAVLNSLDGLDQQVADMVGQLSGMTATRQGGESEQDGKSVQPARIPRWRKLHGDEREEPLARVRAWIEQLPAPATATCPPHSGPAGNSNRCASTGWTG
jgi:hypothetical protein